jgi:diguanylate cyclase (GGDEF)-like protein
MSPTAVSVLTLGLPAALVRALRAKGLQISDDKTWLHAREHDAVLVSQALAQEAAATQAAFDSALLVLAEGTDIESERALLRHGAEAVVTPGDTTALVRQIHHAVERKRLERAARTAYATDLATGLPHQAQLLEHMTQLLALREREPAPMVLLVLRMQGFEQAAATLGVESGNVLRRKVAVRLRGVLRASDVVAAISPDTFGVLLGHLEAKGDGEAVVSKLLRTLQQPVTVAGQPCAVAASVGLALYPDHGKDPQVLMQRASAQAGSVATLGERGYAAVTRVQGAPAANDSGR